MIRLYPSRMPRTDTNHWLGEAMSCDAGQLPHGVKSYVNQATGSDTLDTGRGESASKPFKTIQACLNYIGNNYNIGGYTAKIIVSPGLYDRISIPKFNSTTGTLIISGDSTDRSQVITKHIQNDYAVKTYITDLTIKPDDSNISHSAISSTDGSVYLENICLDLSAEAGGDSANRYGLYATGGTIRIEASSQPNRGLYLKSGEKTITSIFYLSTSGSIVMANDVTIQSNITMNNFLLGQLNGTFNTLKANFPYPEENSKFIIEDSYIVTGNRYYLTLNAVARVGNGGPEFFPGTVAGTTSTGGQYL